jgi:ATP-binding cassette subfamily B protein
MKSQSDSKREWTERLKSLRQVSKVIVEVWKARGSYVAISGISRLVMALAVPLTLWISKQLIDSVIALQHLHGTWSRIWQLCIAEAIVVVLADISGRIANHADNGLSETFSHRLNIRIFDHVNKLDLESLESATFQDQLERARTQISSQLAVLFSTAQLLQSLLSLVILIAAVAIYAPWLVVLQLSALVPLSVLEMRYATILHRKHRERTPFRRTMEYLISLNTGVASVKEIKAFGLGPHFRTEFDNIGDQFLTENAKLSRDRNFFGCLFVVVASFAYYGAYVWLVWEAGHGKISIGALVFLGSSFQRTRWQMQEILTTLARTLDQTLHLGDIFEFFQAGPRPSRRHATIPVPAEIKEGFQLKNVSFRYAGSSSLVLDRVSLTISPGETIALVGANGAGKTTLTKLLARLYEPSDGVILLDGVNILDYNLEQYQKAISVVFQDFIRFDMTVGANIGFGNLSSISDIAVLKKAAKDGRAAELIDRLPDKFQQLLGKRFEGGSELSGGEWQRLALSRACMREAKLLVLDEPTASLDALNESMLLDHFCDLTSGKMAVLVTHRLPTVRMAHKIIVLEQGRVVEQGTHSELISLDATYASLFRLQASGYQDDFRFVRSSTNETTSCVK